MSRRTTFRLLATALLVVLLAALPVEAASSPSAVLGTDGSVYSLRYAHGADLPAQGLHAEARLLSLDVTGSDGTTRSLLVPGTGEQEVENNAAIFYDSSREAVYVLWESSFERFSPYSRLLLASYSADDGWSEPIQLSLSSYVEKSSLHLALTRDEVPRFGVDGQVSKTSRTILHLVWLESNGSPSEYAVYLPILFMGGQFHRQEQPVVLNDLVDIGAAEGAAELTSLDSALSVRAGEDNRTVNVAFGLPDSASLISVKFKVLPGEVSALADALYDFVAAQAAPGKSPATDLAAIGRAGDDFLDDAGGHVSATFLAQAKTQFATLAQSHAGDILSLAEAGRRLIIDLGGRADQSGVRRITGGGRPQWIDVGVRQTPRPGHGGGPGHGDVRSYQIASQVTFEQKPPQVMTERPVTLLNSRDGAELAVYWQDESKLHYLETAADGTWSPTGTIALGESFATEDAVRLLEERLDSR